MAWLTRVVMGVKSGVAMGWDWAVCADAAAGEMNGFIASNRIRAAATAFVRGLLGMRMLATLPMAKVTMAPMSTYQVKAMCGMMIPLNKMRPGNCHRATLRVKPQIMPRMAPVWVA